MKKHTVMVKTSQLNVFRSIVREMDCFIIETEPTCNAWSQVQLSVNFERELFNIGVEFGAYQTVFLLN